MKRATASPVINALKQERRGFCLFCEVRLPPYPSRKRFLCGSEACVGEYSRLHNRDRKRRKRRLARMRGRRASAPRGKRGG